MAGVSQAWLNRVWYGQRSTARTLLLPLSWLFGAVTALRRLLYRLGVAKSLRVGAPVVVVGNVTVGGSGKTPVTIWLVEQLASRGFRPGVVSRGFGASVGPAPLRVDANTDPSRAGDEPVLIAQRTGCPVAVHPDRVAAARLLVAGGADVVIADDGLQHYRLFRDAEVAVVDSARGHGNGCLLPAGPLREPVDRLVTVDQILVNGSGVPPPLPASVRTGLFDLEVSGLFKLDGTKASLEALGASGVHAVAGIGHPERFFRTLKKLGLNVIPHARDDHARLASSDLNFGDGLPVVITEKDAVKCRRESVADGVYCLRVDPVMQDESWVDGLVSIIRERHVAA